MPSDETQADEGIQHPIAARMFSGCVEVIGVDHVEAVLSGSESNSGNNQLVA